MISVSGCAGVETLVDVLRGVALLPVPGVVLRGVFLDLGVVRRYELVRVYGVVLLPGVVLLCGVVVEITLP